MTPRGRVNVAEHLPLKPLDFSVLLVLVEDEEYGYRMVKRIAETRAGEIRLAPSNLYNVLDRMIDAGLVEDRGRRSPVFRRPNSLRYIPLSSFLATIPNSTERPSSSCAPIGGCSSKR